MQDTAYSSDITEGVHALLQSAPHASMDRLLSESMHYPINCGYQSTLRFDTHRGLHLAIASDKIDSRTAASHALIYACWRGDLEMVIWLVQDLREIIDISMTVNGRSILEWTVDFFLGTCFISYHSPEIRRDCMDTAINICRYLIICYGSKIDANRLEGTVLKACKRGYYADVVAYLVTAYGAELVHKIRINDMRHQVVFYGDCNDSVLSILIANGYDAEAVLYLQLFHDQLIPGLLDVVLLPVAYYGSTYMFQTVVDMFGSHLAPSQINIIFSDLYKCLGYYHAESVNEKVRAVLDVWFDQLEATTIENCLIKQWENGYQAREGKMKGLAHICGQTAQLIVKRYVKQLQGEYVQIALAVCCLPSNPELFDTVLDYHLDQISREPQVYLQHALLECCDLRDIDMFGHILGRYGSLIYPLVLEYWVIAGDLKAVSMLFISNTHSDWLVNSAQRSLIIASMQGDAEMTELIIKHVGRSIDESFYRRAFRVACNNDHKSVTRVLSSHRDRIDFRPDMGFDLALSRVRPNMTRLLNSIFGTSYGPSRGCASHKVVKPKGFCVGYGVRPKIWYKLDRC